MLTLFIGVSGLQNLSTKLATNIIPILIMHVKFITNISFVAEETSEYINYPYTILLRPFLY